MNDYDILKYLGLEIRDEAVVFYDDDSNEHILQFNEIKDISFDNACLPVEKKLGFWLEKLFVVRNFIGLVNTNTLNEDYRHIYELEIELVNNRVLSRKVRGAYIYDCKEFISEINKLIRH